MENIIYKNPAKISSSWPRKGIVLAFVHEPKMNILFFEGNICCYTNVPFVVVYACVIIRTLMSLIKISEVVLSN